jgi:glycosyltransferase involved in cell wall biosynthesis
MSAIQPTTFTVIVNTIDRAEPLRALLYSLDHQSYPHFEVIAVVGPTHDHTLDVLREYGDRIEVLRCPAANLSQSRNVGLLAARGEVTAFIDDDAVPSRNWLAQLARLFADDDLDATGGMVYCVHPAMPIVQHRIGIVSSLAEQVDVRESWSQDLPPPGVGLQWTARMMGTNMAYRRDRLLSVAGFDEFFEWVYDDADVAVRLARTGAAIEPVREAVVYHAPASSRNREAYSWNFRTWVQTKSVLYFMIRNGRAAGELPRTIAYRCARFLHGRWILGGNLRRERKLSWAGSWRMRTLEMMGGAIGIWHGLRGERRLIPREQAERAASQRAAIRPFLRPESAFRPSVDPVAARPLATSVPEPPLRICLLSHSYPPHEVEGIGRHTSLMARGLAELGHTVHVVTRGEREQTTFRDGAYVHRVRPSLDRYARFADLPDLFHTLNHTHAAYGKIRRLMLNDGVQIVDSPLWKVDGLVASIGRLLPVVVRVQTANKQVAEIQRSQTDDARLVGDLERAFLERADFLIANSAATVRALEEVYRVDAGPDRCTVIPHGIVPLADEETRPFEIGARRRGLTVLYVGRLERRKGIVDLFAAIPRVLRQVPETRFLIAGHDNSRSDGFQRRMGTTYQNHFLRKHPAAARAVEFLGPVSDQRLADLYAACDLFVAPSLYESFGLIYLEAMNYAKPVIGCQAGGIPEVVAHGETGLLVEPEAPAALAEAIVGMLRSPERLRSFGLAGRTRLLDLFTHRQMAKRFADVYRQVLGRGGEPTAQPEGTR